MLLFIGKYRRGANHGSYSKMLASCRRSCARSGPAPADDYPSRRITLIAPSAGAIDTVCRELAPGVGDLLGQPVVVENRPGVGSTIGTADGAKAAPDGYTLVLAGSGSLAISPTL